MRRRLWGHSLAVLVVALVLHLQGCDDEEADSDTQEEKENVTPVVGGNETDNDNETVNVWVGEHSNPTYGGPPAKLGRFDKSKGMQPDPLPGKGGRLLEAERSYERALLSDNDAAREEHKLDKLQHMEAYYKNHPTTPPTTTTTTTTTLSTNASTPGSEDDTGSGDDVKSSTHAKENTETSTEQGEHSTSVEAPEADKAMTESANGSEGNKSNATGPAAKVGSSEVAPTDKVKAELAIEHAKKLVPSGQHDTVKVPAPREAESASSGSEEKLDEARPGKEVEAGGTQIDEEETEVQPSKTDEESKMDDPNESKETNEAEEAKSNEAKEEKETQDTEQETETPKPSQEAIKGSSTSPQGASKEVDHKDDSSKGKDAAEKEETSSPEAGQEEEDAVAEEQDSSEPEEDAEESRNSVMELGHQAERAARLHRLHREHEALHELELRQDRELQDLRQELERRQNRELEHFRERQHQELELEKKRMTAAESQAAPALLEMDQHLHRHRHGSRKMGQWLQELAEADE